MHAASVRLRDLWRKLREERAAVPLRSIRLPLMLVLLFAVVVALAACGSNTPPEVPRSLIITAPPVPVGTLVAGCTASGLEAWYEVATSLTDRFAIESLAALDLPPDSLPDAISRQSDLLDRIVAEPVPECAGAAQAAIVQRMRAIYGDFLAYDEGQLDAETLRARVTEVHTGLETEVASMLDSLGAGLEELFRLEREAAQPGE